MRILIQCINFHPELISTGKYTADMAAYLACHGHEVHMITAPPYYPYWKVQRPYQAWAYSRETWQGVRVYRCPVWVPAELSNLKRILHLLSFTLSCLPVVFGQIFWKPQVVLCVVPTLFNAPVDLLAARFAGAKAWLHIQDFELDAALGLGMLPGKSRVHPWAAWMEFAILRGFDRVSTISEKMVSRTAGKGVPAERVSLFPNWVDTKQIHPLDGPNLLRAELGIPTEPVIVLYHGNMGRKQGLEILVEAAASLKSNPGILFVLCGDGATRRELELQAAGLPNVRFLDIQPEEKLNALVNMADIHILPQLAGAADLVMPSKLTSMLASGRAVIACADRDTEVWKVVQQVGRVVPPEDIHQLANSILELSGDPAERLRLGQAGRAFALRYLDRERILATFGASLAQWGMQ